MSKITAGSQAEKAGVQLGWLLVKVAGKAMPTKDATKPITAALAAGKKGDFPFNVAASVCDIYIVDRRRRFLTSLCY